MKVSVIMPVYNASAVLPRSLESLRRQRFRYFEVVFVDDGSTDGSPELLEAFAAEGLFPCRVLRAERNGGVAAARNRALEAAQGTFLAFLDADDRMAPDLLEKAVAEAENTQADIVGWDWKVCSGEGGRVICQPPYDTPLEALQGLMGGTMRWNLWLFLVRRELAERERLRFIPEANMGEDMQWMIRAFCKAGKVARIPEPLYLYHPDEASVSAVMNPRRREEVSRNLEEALLAVEQGPYAPQLHGYAPWLKLFIKRPLLISSDRSSYEAWYGWWPEANAFATTNRALPFHTRLLQGAAARRQWWLVKLYNILVYKILRKG